MEIEPVPVAAPMVFPVTFTAPPKMEIPVNIPGAVVWPLVVDKLIPLIVFPCTLDTGLIPTVSSIARYKLANAPS